MQRNPPRAYVERRVLPTVIEPLRADQNTAPAAALTRQAEGAIAAEKRIAPYLFAPARRQTDPR